MPGVASIRERTKGNGTQEWAVLYCMDDKQTSTSFTDFAAAQNFCELANKFGVRNALSTLKSDVTTTGWTVES